MQRILTVAGVLGMIVGTSLGQETIRRVPLPRLQDDAWMLEIGYGDYVRQGDMKRHNRFFIQPQPLDQENPPQDRKPNQWFVTWQDNGAEIFLLQFYFAAQGFEGAPTPEMVDQAEKTLIREFELRPHEQVFLTELRKYGFRPVTIQLVRPMTEEMLLPPVLVETPSLELAGLRPVQNRLELTLLNRSSMAVLAIRFRPGPCPAALHAPNRFLIEAGGEKTLTCRVEPPPAGIPADPGAIVLESALFEDYSYEGDIRFARQELARLSGARQGLKLLIEEIRKALQQDREKEVGPVLQAIFKELNPEKIPLQEELAEEFAQLDGTPGRKDDWLQRLHVAARTVHRMFAREMEWNTRRLIDTGGSAEIFWRMLESREERLSRWLDWLEGNPPGALY